MRLGFKHGIHDGKSLLVGVLLWDLCPVGSELFKMVEQRSHLLPEVSLRNNNAILVNCSAPNIEMHGAFFFFHYQTIRN